MNFSPTLFDRLYQEHRGWVHRWLWAKLGCADSAADLTQETFIRLLRWQQMAGTENLDEPEAYLRVVARGLLVDHLRRKSLEKSYQEILALWPEPSVDSPADNRIRHEDLERIDAALDRLPPRTRQVFVLSQLDGWRYAQIALALNLSTRTIKREMKRATAQCLAITADD